MSQLKKVAEPLIPTSNSLLAPGANQSFDISGANSILTEYQIGNTLRNSNSCFTSESLPRTCFFKPENPPLIFIKQAKDDTVLESLPTPSNFLRLIEK